MNELESSGTSCSTVQSCPFGERISVTDGVILLSIAAETPTSAAITLTEHYSVCCTVGPKFEKMRAGIVRFMCGS